MSTTTQNIQQIVQKALDQFQELGGSAEQPTQVLQRLLETLIKATSAVGGAIWMPTGDPARSPQGAAPAAYRCVARGGRGVLAAQRDQSPVPPAVAILTQVATQCKPTIVAPDSSEFQSTELGHTAQFFVPIDAAGKVYGVIQIIAAPELDPKVYRQFVAFIQQGARSAAIYFTRRQSLVLGQDAAGHAQLLQVTHKLLQVARPRDLIHEFATLARGLLDAQRVAIVGLWGRRSEVAFSDTIDVNRRAVLVRAAEMLAELARQRQTPMTFVKGQSLGDEDAAIGPLLDDLYNLGAACAVCLTPVRDGEQIIAVLIGEYADPALASRKGSTQQDLGHQCGPILAHTLAAYNRPLRRTSGFLAWLRGHPLAAVSRAAAAVAAIAAALYILFFFPVDIVVRGDARLEPARLAQVTAPLDGRIRGVLVNTGDRVAIGQPLLQIDDTDLKLQLSEVEKKLDEESLAWSTASDKSSRGDASATADRDAAHYRLQQLQIERNRLLQKISDAIVRSPIDGVVLTEKPGEKAQMTVTRGTALLAVADLSRFDLVTELREEDLALVDGAIQEGRTVPATFLSRAWPNHPQTTAITSTKSLGPTSTPDEAQRHHVFRVVTPIELSGVSQQLALANPSGRAKLVTGRGSIAYRYGRGLWRFLQMTLFF